MVGIMAGGQGRRAQDITDNSSRPKLLLSLGSETILGRFLRDLTWGGLQSAVSIHVRKEHQSLVLDHIERVMSTPVPFSVGVHIATKDNTGAALKEIVRDADRDTSVLLVYSDTVLPFGSLSQMVSVATDTDLRPDLLVATCPVATRNTDVAVVLDNGPRRQIQLLLKEKQANVQKPTQHPNTMRPFAGVSFLSSSTVLTLVNRGLLARSASQTISLLCELVENADAFELGWSVNVNTRRDYLRALEHVNREKARLGRP